MNPIDTFIYELVEAFKQSKWLPLLTAYAVLSSIIGPGFHYPLLHLPFIIIGLILALKNGAGIEVAPLLLLLYLPINLLITQPDPVFNAWRRLALFAAVFLFVSPLLAGEEIALYRKKILTGILMICVLLGLGSFVCYFLGVNYMGNQVDGSAILDYQGSAGGFGGLMYQSIALGFVCGLGILALLYRALLQEKEGWIWYFILIGILAVTILFSASRSALLSVVAGGLMMIYQVNKKNGRFIPILLGIILVGMLSFPLWERYTVGIATKNEAYSELGAMGSRAQKWSARITEFSTSPVCGIGYASVDKRLDVVGPGGVVEPGSSWLAILSMTGIIGLILFFFVLRKPFQLLKTEPIPYNALMLGLLVFILTHMIAEGYIFAGGSPLCFIAWLIIGCCNDARYAEEEDCLFSLVIISIITRCR